MLNFSSLLNVPQASIYNYNVATLKKYNENNYKLVIAKACRKAGYVSNRDNIKGKKNSAGNITKLEESLSRTRSKIYELSACNPWEYFVTLTISPDGHNRHDLKTFYKELSKWLNNIKYRSGVDIKYLLIPEPHKDGAWHFHGLFYGIPDNWLTEFSMNDTLPYKVRKLISQGRHIYNWNGYAEKFGYVTCERIINFEACAKYVTKYITKELVKTSVGLNNHLYYCSKGLLRAERIRKGYLVKQFEPDFANDFVAVKTFTNISEALAYFSDNIDNCYPVSFDSILQCFLIAEERNTRKWKPCILT